MLTCVEKRQVILIDRTCITCAEGTCGVRRGPISSCMYISLILVVALRFDFILAPPMN